MQDRDPIDALYQLQAAERAIKVAPKDPEHQGQVYQQDSQGQGPGCPGIITVPWQQGHQQGASGWQQHNQAQPGYGPGLANDLGVKRYRSGGRGCQGKEDVHQGDCG